MSLNTGWAEHPGLRRRFLLLSLATIGIFLLLLLRLWYLQVIGTERYRALSERNRIRDIPITAPRGSLYDRDGELLVDTRASFSVVVIRQAVENKGLLLGRLAGYLGVPLTSLEQRWEEGRKFPSYQPFAIAEDVSRDIVERVQENSVDLPGVMVEARPLRYYPYQELGAHLFGYIGEITEEDLRQERFAGYRPGDSVGKSGLEKAMESELRGQEGERLIEVDVRGKELRSLKTLEPQPGNRVYLTLQRGLQQAAEEALIGQAGAAVAIDVNTGDVLAMASSPAFNPAVFARGISAKEWVSLLDDPRHPLQDKALKGQYPPGSTFKIVTVLAALRAGVAGPATSVNCSGSLQLGNREFRCWKKDGHGYTDLHKALRESCDVWFYQVALSLGIDRIAAMARELGLGRSLGFELPGEKSGLIPDRDWKLQRYGTRWYDGESLNTAIGQGYVTVTPLQLAVMTAAVANGGKVFRPHIVKQVVGLDGAVLRTTSPELLNTVQVSAADLAVVRSGLEAVVNEPGGTGASSRLNSVRVAGKTGTSQVVRMKEGRVKSQDVAYLLRDHALFVAYAPASAPRIAVAVVVEHGSHGGSSAGPVARAIFANYFGIDTAAVPPPPDVVGD